jgi:hypothetical protein
MNYNCAPKIFIPELVSADMEKPGSDKLEFEPIEVTDLQISKPFGTDGGDTIRVVFTAGGNAMITSDRKSDYPDVILGDLDAIGDNIAKKGFWGRVWDWLKGKVAVGGPMKCTTTVTPILDKDTHKPVGVMASYSCTRM